jgi:hypothetical protein
MENRLPSPRNIAPLSGLPPGNQPLSPEVLTKGLRLALAFFEDAPEVKIIWTADEYAQSEKDGWIANLSVNWGKLGTVISLWGYGIYFIFLWGALSDITKSEMEKMAGKEFLERERASLWLSACRTAWEDWKREGGKQPVRPGIDDIRHQVQILRRSPHSDLPKELQNVIRNVAIDQKSLKHTAKPLRDVPLIILPDTREEDVIAQMCTLACQQGHQGEKLISYLTCYIGRVLWGDFLPEDSETVFNHLILHWGVPRYRNGFRAYIRRIATDFEKQGKIERKDLYSEESAGSEDRNEDEEQEDVEEGSEESNEGWKQKGKKEGYRQISSDGPRFKKVESPEFPLAVKDAAKLLFQRDPGTASTESVVERWLYYQFKRKGRNKVPNALARPGRIGKITPEGVCIRRDWFQLDEEGFKEAERLWKIKCGRQKLVECLERGKKITPRAARKWIKVRVDKGWSWEDIQNDALKVLVSINPHLSGFRF